MRTGLPASVSGKYQSVVRVEMLVLDAEPHKRVNDRRFAHMLHLFVADKIVKAIATPASET